MILRSLPRPQGSLVVARSRLSRRSSTLTRTSPLSHPLKTRPRWQAPVPCQRHLATRPSVAEGHYLPRLAHDNVFKTQGIPGLLTPESFDMAWTQYQSMMIDKLNSLTQGTADASTRVQALVEKYARSTQHAALFNCASMAFNNQFCFSGLTPNPSPPSAGMLAQIEHSFSSLSTLRAELIATAGAMFGPGFVWVVKANDTGALKILATYLAGSPLPRAHPRAQSMDLNTQTNPFGRYGDPAGLNSPGRQAGAGAGGYDATPVLGVSTWQHTYLRDYGVAGKEKFLEKWWEKVDWSVVEMLARDAGPERRVGTAGVLQSSFNKMGGRW